MFTFLLSVFRCTSSRSSSGSGRSCLAAEQSRVQRFRAHILAVAGATLLLTAMAFGRSAGQHSAVGARHTLDGQRLAYAFPTPTPTPTPSVELDVNTAPEVGPGTPTPAPVWSNNSSDFVTPLSGTLKWGHATLCRVAFKNSYPNAVNIVVVTPPRSSPSQTQGLIGFSSPTGNTLSLTLTPGSPSGYGEMDFNVAGMNGSSGVGDVPIQVHQDSATGPLLTSGTFSVSWFHVPQMNVTQGGNYQYQSQMTSPSSNILMPSGQVAVSLGTLLTLEPPKVSVSTPQLAALRFGFVQNNLAPGTYTTTWDTPTWPEASKYPGDTVTVPSYAQNLNYLGDKTDDALTNPTVSSGPTYHSPQPVVSGLNQFNDTDGPQSPASIVLPTQWNATTAKGITTYVTYNGLSQVKIDSSFLDWCVLYNTAIGQPKIVDGVLLNATQSFIESGWSVHADSVAIQKGVTQVASVDSLNVQPTDSMKLSTDPNNYANNLAKDHYSQVGSLVTLP